MTLRRTALTLCLAMALPLPALAEGKLAYVIGNTRFGGPALDAPEKDAVSISRALLGLGFDVVRRQNVSARDFPIGTRAAETVALYYSGRTSVTDTGDILLRGAQLGDAETPGWPVLETARALRAAGAQNVLVFIETCQAEGDTLDALPEADETPGLLLAISHDPSLGCPVTEASAEETDTETDAAAPEDAAQEPAAEADAATDTAPALAEDATETDAPRFTERLQLALATPDLPLDAAFEAAAGTGWFSAALETPLFLWPQDNDDAATGGGGRLPDGALALLESLAPEEQARMREVWQTAGLMDANGQVIDRAAQPGPTSTILVAPEASSSGVTIIAPVSTPVSPVIPQDAPGGTRVAGRVAPVQPSAQRPQGNGGTAPSGSGAGASAAVQIFTPAQRSAAPAALPVAEGLPEPYLIFGEIRPINASFDPTETGELQGNALDTSSFETRNQIRNDQPDLYAELVAGGAFDPEDGSERGLARAIQTELARMNCYTSGIDGIWGGGSRNSVAAYFQQISETPTGLEPTLDLFRKIILNDDVSCPAVQQAAQPARSTGTTPQRAAPAAAPQPQQPAGQAPASGGGLNTNNLGSGIFR